MTEKMPTRAEAFALLTSYNQNDALIKHALAVEAVMRFMARQYNQDEEVWGLVGLIHDLDYEQFPEEHCHKTAGILREHHWPEDLVRAVMSHGWGICTDVKPITEMEKVLYTVDELTGLVAATALVRPSKSVLDVEVKSVKKKWKEKSFAAGVNREIIQQGADMLGLDLAELIDKTILAMREVAQDIGLGSV